MHDRFNDIGVELREETGRAVALPATALEAAAVVGLARDEGRVVTPCWALPEEDAPGPGQRAPLYVSIERLAGIAEVVPADLMAVVGAGVTVGALEERIADDGLCWPPASTCGADDLVGDILAQLPGGWTMAGNLTRRYLLALEAVLADGSIVSAGARTVKSVTGYDLKQLLVGSRGTLGIITSLTLRLEAVANRENVLARYSRDFAGMEGPVAGSAGAGDGALLILERIKCELDPGGVFPGIDTQTQDDARA